jgi:glycogen synthase
LTKDIGKENGNNTHKDAKVMLQNKYFPLAVDERIPLLSFIGNLSEEEKGISLLLDAVENLIERVDGKIQFIISCGKYRYIEPPPPVLPSSSSDNNNNENDNDYSTPLSSSTNSKVYEEIVDVYGNNCAGRIIELKTKYPNSFYCDLSSSFIQPASLLYYGSDFGIIPSLYEPSGFINLLLNLIYILFLQINKTNNN